MEHGPGLKMYVLFENGDIPASYVSLPEGLPGALFLMPFFFWKSHQMIGGLRLRRCRDEGRVLGRRTGNRIVRRVRGKRWTNGVFPRLGGIVFAEKSRWKLGKIDGLLGSFQAWNDGLFL